MGQSSLSEAMQLVSRPENITSLALRQDEHEQTAEALADAGSLYAIAKDSRYSL